MLGLPMATLPIPHECDILEVGRAVTLAGSIAVAAYAIATGDTSSFYFATSMLTATLTAISYPLIGSIRFGNLSRFFAPANPQVGPVVHVINPPAQAPVNQQPDDQAVIEQDNDLEAGLLQNQHQP